MTSHITSISISGLRTLEQFTLKLDGLTVLIGENGCGKSSVIEAFELLRRLTSTQFTNDYNQVHGGDGLLLRHGSQEIRIFVELAKANTWEAKYDVAFSRNGIRHESLSFQDGRSEWLLPVARSHDKVQITSVFNDNTISNAISPYESAISQDAAWHPNQGVRDAIDTLQRIDVQLPFDILSHWAAKSQGNRVSPMRDSVTIAPAPKLERFGSNLPNAYFSLRNECSAEEWEGTMDLVRMGLGDWVESVNTRSDASGGKIGLWIKPRHIDTQFPAASLSDGQLSYLAFVALVQLPTERSVLCFDELELHLHPRLLTQVIGLLEIVAVGTPVVITTHSRRLLDELEDPAKSVNVLELNPTLLRTELRKFDCKTLDAWLEDYEGLGRLLDAGYQPSLLTELVPRPTES
jgi:predicted ATPase